MRAVVSFRVSCAPTRLNCALFHAGEVKAIVVSKDDGIRPGTTAEKLSKLPSAFKADGSTTAGTLLPMLLVVAAGVLTP